MTTCVVVCRDCGKVMPGPCPSKIDYRMTVVGGKLVPLCPECREDRRSTT